MADEIDDEIQRIVNQLDECVSQYESKWGSDNLYGLVSDDLRIKFDSQNEKFRQAMINRDVNTIRDLAGGFKRAYAVFETYALEQGFLPSEINSLLYETKTNKVYVGLTHNDVRKLMAKYRGQEGVKIFSMAEVASVMEKQTLGHYKANTGETSDPFDFSVGDKIKLK